MPPRLNKRQQRELDELSALGASAGAVSTSDAISDDEEVVPQTKSGVGFSSRFLMQEDGEGDGEEEEEETVSVAKRKKKKNKKKSDTLASAPTPPPQRNEKKAAKRAKAKERKAGQEALAELSLQYPSTATSTAQSPSHATPPTLNALLSVSLAHLDPTAELRKFFGSRVVSSSTTSTPSTRKQKIKTQQKSNLTRPQPGWWSASQREGLSIRALDQGEARELEARRGWVVGDDKGKGEERWWTVEYSQRYKSMTKLFIQAVMSGHPDALWEVQRKLPWHADNLLQLAEVYRHREEYAQAVDFVDRALFTYERAFIGAFTFTTGTNRLDFDRVENRPFFLALHRQIADLQRRGCTRTAFEFSRLLYALDPHTDPHGALFHLDLLALKSGMGAWLCDVWEYFDRKDKDKEGKGKMNPSLLPGWAYARALAMKIKEGDTLTDPSTSPSTDALKEAIQSFPEVVPLLADKLDLVLPAHIRSHSNFKIHTDAGTLPPAHAALHALVHMYTAHSSSPWKDPSSSSLHLSTWLQDTLISLFPSPSLPNTNTPRRTALLSLLAHKETETHRTLARHILVLEGTHRRLLGYLSLARGVQGMACDPVPPGTGVSRYDEGYFVGVEDVFGVGGGGRGGRGGRGRGGEGRRGVEEDENDERMLRGLIEDREVRERVLLFIRGIRAQFPGGLQEMFERLGPEAVEDVLGQVQGLIVGDEGEGVGEGGMPGAFGFGFAGEGEGGGEGVHDAPVPVVPEHEHEHEEEEEEEEEEQLSGIQMMFRNVLGRFWNGAVGIAVMGDTSSDEEDYGVGDEEESESEGVD